MFLRREPQPAACGQRRVRKAVGGLERDEFTVVASDPQRLDNLSAGQHARRPAPPTPPPNPRVDWAGVESQVSITSVPLTVGRHRTIIASSQLTLK